MKPITKVVFILGTKAQFIKSYPLLQNLNNKNIKLKIIDTGQHKKTTSTQLDILDFDYKYKSISKNKKDIATISKLIRWFLVSITKIIFSKPEKEKTICILHGDTASTLIGLVWAKKNKSIIFHIESGSRSGKLYRPFPEELIRIVTEKFSDYLVCEYEFQIKNLNKYKSKKEIIFTGHPTIVDSILDTLPGKLLSANKIFKNNLIVTIHRTENIFNQKYLLTLVGLLEEIKNKNYFDEIIWFCHPPTINALKKGGYYKRLIKNEILVEKLLPYKEFLKTIYQSKCVFTDGGGVIQEATYLNIPTVVWRNKNNIDIQFKNNKNVLISNYDLAKVKNFLKNLESKNRILNNNIESPSEKISIEIENIIISSTI